MINSNEDLYTAEHESEVCARLMATLRNLDMGYSGLTTFIYARELYILLAHGSEELKKIRNNMHWWG